MDDDFMCDEDDDYDLVRLYGFACLVESELSGAECRIWKMKLYLLMFSGRGYSTSYYPERI
jgi:hypothetical protein